MLLRSWLGWNPENWHQKSLVWRRIPCFWAFYVNLASKSAKNHKMSIFGPFCLSKVYICIHLPPKTAQLRIFWCMKQLSTTNRSRENAFLRNFRSNFKKNCEKRPGGSRFWSNLLNFDLGSLIIHGVNQKIGTRHIFAKKVIWSPPYF